MSKTMPLSCMALLSWGFWPRGARRRRVDAILVELKRCRLCCRETGCVGRLMAYLRIGCMVCGTSIEYKVCLYGVTMSSVSEVGL